MSDNSLHKGFNSSSYKSFEKLKLKRKKINYISDGEVFIGSCVLNSS